MCAEHSEDRVENKTNAFHFRGTSLGGFFILEPWITPSLFYQFLGKTVEFGEDAYTHIAFDSFSFCTVLGAEEANRQLRQHWKTWVDEAQIVNLAHSGVETLRIPVGDWMFVPYHPYIGCWDGALDELDRVLQLCEKHNITVLLDLHAVKMSQNGLDNSGNTEDYAWDRKPILMNGRRESHFRHWDIRGGNWIGNFNTTSQTYVTFNQTNVEESLEVIKIIVHKYKDVSAVIGIEPVNEPWWEIPLDELKDFYWRSYQIVQDISPTWVTLMHDSFRLWPSNFGGDWMKNCENWAMDTHLYQAWSDPTTVDGYISMTCGTGYNIALMESIGVPVIVGEWSLATDNCAMWLNGFNDNLPGFPKVSCDRTMCPDPYMGSGQPGAPPHNVSVDTMDPRGSGGESFVINRTCPLDKQFPNETSSMQRLAYAHLHVFDRITHGNFFWNFRTEFEPRWDYQKAVQNKWIPKEWSFDSKEGMEIDSSCSIFDFHVLPEHSNVSPSLTDTDTLTWLVVEDSLISPLLLALGTLALIMVFALRKFVCSQRLQEYLAIPSDVEYQVEIARTSNHYQ